MATTPQTPEERKRMHAEMLQDPQYARSRKMLLWVSVLSTCLLAGAGLMVAAGKLSLEVAAAIIGGCVLYYFYSLFSLVKHRTAAESRWWLAKDSRRAAKKEKKRKGGR